MKSLFLVLALSLPNLPGCSINPPPQTGFDCNAPAPTGLVKVKGAIAGKYIVVLKPPAGLAVTAAQSIASVQAFASQFVGLKNVKTSSQGFSAEADAVTLKALLASPRVKYVQEEGTKSINAVPWGLDRSDARDLPLDGKYEPGADGAGIHAYVIDTGLEEGNAEFAGRVGEGFSVFGGPPTDGHGHGSHVAGTVAGTKFGIAKKATVHGVRVLNAQGSGTDSEVIRGIDWVTQHCQANGWACVANMSLGGSAAPALDEAVCRSIAAGVSYGIAAGNDNLGACNYSPARVVQALTAGASDSGDAAASFSNDGPCIDLYAPGVDVESIGGTMSGTSMASPHVTGGAALCLARRPGSPADVHACVVNLATPNKIDGQPLLYVKE